MTSPYDLAPLLPDMVALINKLDIQVAHPHMDGSHQCAVRGDRQNLTATDWAVIVAARETETA